MPSTDTSIPPGRTPVTVTLATLLLAGCSSGQEPPPVRFERTVVEVGGSPYALGASDVTGDGALDLLVADQSGGRVVVLEGDGVGGFAEIGAFAAGSGPGGLAVADFDGDGHPDLAVANHETDHLTLLRGLGGGAFEPHPGSPLSLGVAPHVHLVASADLDEDGHADLVVDHRDAGGLRIFRGLGNGGFGPGRTVDMGGDPYRAIRIADLDGDGHLDLATPNEHEVGVRLGRGDGTFHPPRNVDVTPLAPFALAVGDVDGDGNADLGLDDGEGGSEAVVLPGDGSGRFRRGTGETYGVGSGAKFMEASDLDGDGADDLIVASWASRRLTLLFGGDGRLRRQEVEAGENPWAVTAADFDGDGRADVATANYGDGTVTVLLTRQTGRRAGTSDRGSG